MAHGARFRAQLSDTSLVSKPNIQLCNGPYSSFAKVHVCYDPKLRTAQSRNLGSYIIRMISSIRRKAPPRRAMQQKQQLYLK